MRKIVIVNSKGGSGKTTITVNLASALAKRGEQVALMDLDPQGSSMRWLSHRSEELPGISGIAAFRSDAKSTRSFQLSPAPGTTTLIVDTPAGLDRRGLEAATRGADAVLMPVMPSDIDIHAATHCIADLLLGCKGGNNSKRMGIVANRVKANTRNRQRLERFLETFDIPVVATLRDSVNYTRSAETGQGLLEMPRWQTHKDIEDWERLVSWVVASDEKKADKPGQAPLRVGLSGAVRLAFSRNS